MNSREIQNLVNNVAKQCVVFFKEQGWVDSNWGAKVKTSFSTRRNRSWGGSRRGVPFISLSLSRFLNTDAATFFEYKSFCHDKEIGTVSGNTIKAIKALVVHEMCHAVQFSRGNEIAASMAVGNDVRGHGALWKNLYRTTRNALVNNVSAQQVQSVSMPVEKPVVKQVINTPSTQNVMKRADAFVWIRQSRAKGLSNSSIIKMLVEVHGFKKTTATTYTYTA